MDQIFPTFLLGIFIGGLLAYCIARYDNKEELRKIRVQCNCGYYNSETGNFIWAPKK